MSQVDISETIRNLQGLEDELKEMTEAFEYTKIGYDIADGILTLTLNGTTTEHEDLPDMLNYIMDVNEGRIIINDTISHATHIE